MEIVLLDTDVFSFLWQDRPEGEPYRPLVAGRIAALSFTSVGKAHYGVHHGVPLITHNRRHFEHIPEVDLLLPA